VLPREGPGPSYDCQLYQPRLWPGLRYVGFRDCCFLCACLHYPTLIPLRRKSKIETDKKKDGPSLNRVRNWVDLTLLGSSKNETLARDQSRT